MGDLQMYMLTNKLLEALNKHDLQQLSELYASEYVGTDVGEREVQRGPDGASKNFARYLSAFPDLQIHSEQVIEGDNAVLVWKAQGTHRGSWLHIPPTGRNVEIQGTTVLTARDGKFIRSVNIWDLAGLLRAFGLLPEL